MDETVKIYFTFLDEIKKDIAKLKEYSEQETKKDLFSCKQISEKHENIEWDFLDETKKFKTTYVGSNRERKAVFVTDIVSVLRVDDFDKYTVLTVTDKHDARLPKPEVILQEHLRKLVEKTGFGMDENEFVSFIIRKTDANSHAKTFVFENGNTTNLKMINSRSQKTGDLFELCFQPLWNVGSGEIQWSILSAKEVYFPQKKIIGRFKVERLRNTIRHWKKYATCRKRVRQAEIKKMAVHLYTCPDFEFNGETYHGKGYLKGLKRFENKQTER